MAKMTIIGCKHFNGEIDGSRFQSLKVTCVLPMEETDDNSGSAGSEFKVKYELLPVLKPYYGKFPVELDVELTAMAGSGGRVVHQVTSIKPITTPVVNPQR